MDIDKNIKITVANARYNCRVLGSGTNIIIAFHGFGQDGNVYAQLVDRHPQFLIYSFDLPFHGETMIDGTKNCLSADDIKLLIDKLIESEGLSRFSLLGFSIGTKLALQVIDRFANQIDQIWLLAPDGIVLNFWYRLATSTKLMRGIFRHVLQRTGSYGQLLQMLFYLGIINKNEKAYAANSIKTTERGNMLCDTWIYLRCLKIYSKNIAEMINTHQITCDIILADHDFIISNREIKRWSRNIHNVRIKILESTHANLVRNFISRFADQQ